MSGCSVSCWEILTCSIVGRGVLSTGAVVSLQYLARYPGSLRGRIYTSCAALGGGEGLRIFAQSLYNYDLETFGFARLLP
jgi:pimeloyl-ACP methyl ester carboxylesterase